MARRIILKRFGFTALAAIIVGRFSRFLNSPCRLTGPDGQPRGNEWLGQYGECVAADWLRAEGCRILARNFRGPRGGEVDLIVRDGRLLVFVEVKTRSANTRIRPLDAVDRPKQRLIERGADAWLKRLGNRNVPWRFDVMEILVEDGKRPRVNRVRDAF